MGNCRIVPQKKTDITYSAYTGFLYGRHHQGAGLKILPLTPAIAGLAESGIVGHRDPGGRIIAATALTYQAPLITADDKLRSILGLQCIW